MARKKITPAPKEVATPITLESIDSKITYAYGMIAEEQQELADRVGELEDEILELKRMIDNLEFYLRRKLDD